MAKLVLLLRGVNVGGVKLPMADFRALLSGMGLTSVETCIQSGNAVFDDPAWDDLSLRLTTAMQARFGFAPAMFVYTAAEFDSIAAESPYAAEGDAAGNKVHVFFISGPATLNHEALQALAVNEKFLLTARAFHLYAPDGIGRSVLAEKLPRHLKALTTARNWNTLRKLQAMLAP